MNRRGLLTATTALVTVGAIAACTSTTQNGVTTWNVNVGEVVAYASGIAALASTFLGFPGLAAALGASVVSAINQAISGVNTVAPSILSAAGGTMTFTFDMTKPPQIIGSIEQNIQKLASLVATGMTSLGKSDLATSVQSYANGVQSVSNALLALFSIKVGVPSKAEADAALAMVGIKAP